MLWRLLPNKRLQRPAFVYCEVLPATSRGFASILRLVAVMASYLALARLFGPPLKRTPFGGLSHITRECHVRGSCSSSLRTFAYWRKSPSVV